MVSLIRSAGRFVMVLDFKRGRRKGEEEKERRGMDERGGERRRAYRQ